MKKKMNGNHGDRYRGLLLGTAVGDALGLPREGLSRARAERLFPGPLGHGLLGRSGMISDDTEHTIFVANALLSHSGSPDVYARRLARSFRWWLLSLPAAVGFATARAILKLWLGFSPKRSGVFSAGNGPAMRAALVGAWFADDPDAYIAANTLITHTDPRALTGARAIALVAAWIMRNEPTDRPDPDPFLSLLRQAGGDPEWRALVEAIQQAINDQLDVGAFADRLGLSNGVTGYTYHTVPVVLYAWYRHFGDYRATIESVIACGGDADTTGAIAGAVAGLTVGGDAIPANWIHGLRDWPRGIRLLNELAVQLARGREGHPVLYFWPAVPLRNLLFLLIVLLHALRRLLPQINIRERPTL